MYGYTDYDDPEHKETHMPAPTRTLITFNDAVARIAEAVEAKGADYVNAVKEDSGFGGEWKTCQYVTDAGDEPSCIVGTAFFAEIIDAGMTAEDVGNQSPVGSLFQPDSEAGVLAKSGYDLTDKALAFLVAMQRAQDTGRTWGEAVAAGHAFVNDIDADDTVAVIDPAYAR